MAVPFRPNRRPEASPRLLELVCCQGRRELAVANVFSAGIRFAPTLDDKHLLARHCAEELEHLERAASLYDELGGGDLVRDLARDQTAVPSDWTETVVAGYLLDQANFAQLRSYIASANPALSELARHLLGDEQKHVHANEATLHELLAHGATVPELQAHVDAWLPAAMALLDRSDAGSDPSEASAPDAGSSGATAERFLSSVGKALAPLGLRAARARPGAPAPLLREAASGPIARVLHPEIFERLAGSRTFERGQECYRAGHVTSLERRGGCLLARVLGASSYAVTIWVSGDRLAYACNCPAGVEGSCCKHVVAVGLAWLGQRAV